MIDVLARICVVYVVFFVATVTLLFCETLANSEPMNWMAGCIVAAIVPFVVMAICHRSIFKNS